MPIVNCVRCTTGGFVRSFLEQCTTKLTYHPLKQPGFSVNNWERQPPIPITVTVVFIVLKLPFSLLKKKSTLKKKKYRCQHALLNFLWMLSTKETAQKDKNLRLINTFCVLVGSPQVSRAHHLPKVPHKFKTVTLAGELNIELPLSWSRQVSEHMVHFRHMHKCFAARRPALCTFLGWSQWKEESFALKFAELRAVDTTFVLNLVIQSGLFYWALDGLTMNVEMRGEVKPAKMPCRYTSTKQLHFLPSRQD